MASSITGDALNRDREQSELGTAIGERLDLFQGLGHRVAVVWIAGHGAHLDDEAAVDGGGDADFAAVLVARPRLAFGGAVDIELVQGVDLALGLRSLGAAALRNNGVLNTWCTSLTASCVHFCTRLPDYAGWCGFSGPVLMWR